jgi:hypothetical protein
VTAWPAILLPFDPREAINLKEAAYVAGRTTETIKNWCQAHHIGRKIGGTYAVSRPALQMFLEDDRKTLQRYLAGDRASESVAGYFARYGLAGVLAEAQKIQITQKAKEAP